MDDSVAHMLSSVMRCAEYTSEQAEEKRLGVPQERKKKVSADPIWQEEEEVAWDIIRNQPKGHRVIFENIEIAKDGGLSQVDPHDLWQRRRYVFSITLVLVVFYNIYFLFSSDLKTILSSHEHEVHGYLLIKSTAEAIFPDLDLAAKPRKLLCALELSMLLFHLGRALWRMYRICTQHHYLKWGSVSDFFWEDIPGLSSFSCIKLLRYVAPTQLTYDLSSVLSYKQHRERDLQLLYLFISRSLALAVGLDCFLMKYRQAEIFIMTQDFSWRNVGAAAIFMNQVLGVVQISRNVKRRLYRFIFAGEDGIMTKNEEVRQDVWDAMVAHLIFRRFPLHQALAMMISWNDNDFQKVALNEKAKS